MSRAEKTHKTLLKTQKVFMLFIAVLVVLAVIVLFLTDELLFKGISMGIMIMGITSIVDEYFSFWKLSDLDFFRKIKGKEIQIENKMTVFYMLLIVIGIGFIVYNYSNIGARHFAGMGAAIAAVAAFKLSLEVIKNFQTSLIVHELSRNI